ncbi:hypothetical protein predicted by Glimmer/Critica [Acetobacter senegalensis]|uniref:Uncharacterized protein n=1 Tax=Acetobacter senegalensis TaxID=446692 RepID=A0A0U5B6A6_9PROT|nr:hypothetical protein predicted by Glimmer/Critica [Acetobacter senegalensis]
MFTTEPETLLEKAYFQPFEKNQKSTFSARSKTS